MNIELIKGDITKITTDAIVNAANTSLLGGGGVDGAIHRGGGSLILEECKKIRNRQGGCKVGEAVYTSAGDLEAKYVIHTVGPKWNGGESMESTKLANCYLNSLLIADELELSTIAFPNISTGIYGYPKLKAAKIAVNAVNEFNSSKITKVVFVCFDDENYKLYKEIIMNLAE